VVLALLSGGAVAVIFPPHHLLSARVEEVVCLLEVQEERQMQLGLVLAVAGVGLLLLVVMGQMLWEQSVALVAQAATVAVAVVLGQRVRQEIRLVAQVATAFFIFTTKEKSKWLISQ
jgi:hypothetical protein